MYHRRTFRLSQNESTVSQAVISHIKVTYPVKCWHTWSITSCMIREKDKCLDWYYEDVWYEREIDIYSSSIRVSGIHYIALLSSITTLIDDMPSEALTMRQAGL